MGTRILSALGASLTTAGVTLNTAGFMAEHYHWGVQLVGLLCQFLGGFLGHVTAPVQQAFARDAERAVREQG